MKAILFGVAIICQLIGGLGAEMCFLTVFFGGIKSAAVYLSGLTAILIFRVCLGALLISGLGTAIASLILFYTKTANGVNSNYNSGLIILFVAATTLNAIPIIFPQLLWIGGILQIKCGK